MRFRNPAIILAAGTLAAGLGIGLAGGAGAASDPTIPAPTCLGFDNAAEILELG
jgi:hypothetical protein